MTMSNRSWKVLAGAGAMVLLCLVSITVARIAALASPLSLSTKEDLRSASVPLVTPEAGHGFTDMQPLKQVVGKARVVALGEATHGTREFFQLKHRLLEYLVAEMGFEIFAIEASWPDCARVNDFVMNGRGDPRLALGGLGFWTWDTEEVLQMILWMRQWNEDATHVRKVTFTGFDMQNPIASARALKEYLTQAVPNQFIELDTILPIVLAARAGRSPQDGERSALRQAVSGLAARMDQSRASLVAHSSEDAWAVMRHHARLLCQYEEMCRGGNQDGRERRDVRDQAMAENALWALERHGPAAKMVVWAHNAHVSFETGAYLTPMGAHLRRALRSDLVAIGFVFDNGRFQARSGLMGPLREFTVAPAFRGSLEWGLRQIAYPLFVLDLRRIPRGSEGATWLARRRSTREVGSIFDPGHAARSWSQHVVMDRFDALVFFEATTRARPLRSLSTASGILRSR